MSARKLDINQEEDLTDEIEESRSREDGSADAHSPKVMAASLRVKVLQRQMPRIPLIILIKMTDQELESAGAQESIGRNEPCPCKSGKKYKRCCGVNAAPKVTPPAAF